MEESERIIMCREKECARVGVDVPPLFVAAPMVRYSKLPFRRLVSRYGCDFAYTPMIYADCFVKSEKCRLAEFVPSPGDCPIVQFAAKRAQEFANAAQLVYGHCRGIDLNCGCPKSDVRSDGYGSKLLEEPELVADIVRQCRASIADPDFTISIKIRLQYPIERTVDLCQKVERAGVSHIAVHARTVSQRSEPPDYASVALLKDCLKIPLIVNGGCKTFGDALEIARTTGADGVMVANGLLDNPALFAGHSTTPKQCVLDWLNLEQSERIPFDLFHQQLIFMLRTSLPKQQRNIFNALKGSDAVREFLTNSYFSQ
ncbi:hypothetical protein GPALN_005283 [Globodera pallida]|nr:hypothetical protein GPALN_005283 [Globodera pallida]